MTDESGSPNHAGIGWNESFDKLADSLVTT